ncbi:carbamoyltransferase HypF [Halomonas getboli]|uniref:carbamoyltransferase HypF n=1 Tax=Halomonas getboli TaxID=2935862 RepID=UPI0020004B17|nr:carbamoyltransferase HypF [Halomonas getboli]MCK2184701.1 carbamoyltransferase HypF [Halomonas getboli]
MAASPGDWLARLRALPRPASGRLRVMNVCGGHERTITQSGLRKVLPDYLELIPGPGCPVCVCPEEDIHTAIALSLTEGVIVATFGDMVRVPCNAPRREPRSLQVARARGGRVQPVASPAEALALARRHPEARVVFFVAGFETTTAPVAALFSRPDLPDNLLLLLSARQTWPAVAHLLDGERPDFDALIAPGHVATLMGADQWRFVPEDHGLPTAVAGFTPALILAGLHAVLVQVAEGQARLDNAYPQCVGAAGNPRARALLAERFAVGPAQWRGIGVLPGSGYACGDALAERDARRRFPEALEAAYRRRGEMPPGCDCAGVVLGRIRPPQCRLYGRACRPESPVGPCMVSEEGACRLWWSGGVTDPEPPDASPPAVPLTVEGPEAARRWVLEGGVQGVGFRPFVHRLAHRLDLAGRVRNQGGRVVVEAQGPPAHLARFARALVDEAPPRAAPRITESRDITAELSRPFTILASDGDAPGPLPRDLPVCAACLAEMADPADRRHRYPFTHCDQCGPRYSVIEALPYDRARTSLAAFPLCAACRREYEDPEDRRFHAQSIGCPDCGPRLRWVGGDREIPGNEAALAAAVAALAEGRIVAVKGVGGYHLMADAGRPEAVARLRARKHRPDKPFAVMFPWTGADGLDAVRRHAVVEPVAARALTSDERPIVLVALCEKHSLAAGIAPSLGEVGALLPYAPLHHLLLQALDRPLVATSANPGGDPIVTDAATAEAHLGKIADAFLHHDREIRHAVDDGVRRVIADRARPLRLGRGATPLELTLPAPLSAPVLATGAHQKATLALAWGQRLVLSPHLGDLDGLRAQQAFADMAERLGASYGVRPEAVLHDRHPDYHGTRWARDSGLPRHGVAHHHAHAAALCGEHGRLDETLLVFTWDGTGLGDDGTLWGGEALLGRPGRWRRHASLLPFALTGGEAAIRAPWRLAALLGWQAGLDWRPEGVAEDELALLHQAWRRRLNSPSCSAVGRLFDAAAALLLGLNHASFEAQAAMQVEALAEGEGRALALPLARDDSGVLRVDWRPLVRHLADARRSPAERAADLHSTLAESLRHQARAAREASGIATVGLSGGVFQNRRLTELAAAGLAADGFEVLLHERLPCNDAAVSVGQVIEHIGRTTAPGHPMMRSSE